MKRFIFNKIMCYVVNHLKHYAAQYFGNLCVYVSVFTHKYFLCIHFMHFLTRRKEYVFKIMFSVIVLK